jgi:glycine oxidase
MPIHGPTAPRHYNKNMSEPDVLIVGGGVIGLTTAYFLARAGAGVTVVDQGDLGHQASWAGAGIISPADPALARTPFDLLRARSCALYPDLSRALLEETGIDNGYFVCGGLEIPEGGEEAPADEWRGEGIAFTRVDEADLRRLEPRLAPGLTHGYHLPHVAQVRNPRHLKALQGACERLRVTLRPHCPARALVRGKGRILAVETDSGPLAAGRFLLAAGAWTDALLGPLGWRPGIRPVRGQIALLDTGVPGPRPVLLVGKRYLVPRADGRLLAGSTEEDAGFDARPTGGGIAGLLEFAVSLVPALAAAPLERCWAGLRPGSPDGLPYLGPVPGWDNLFVAAGHFRSGIQLSPVTGLVLSEVLTGRPPSLPLEPFRLDRPQSAFRS